MSEVPSTYTTESALRAALRQKAATYSIDLPIKLNSGDVMSFSADDAAEQNVQRVTVQRASGASEQYRRFADGWREVFVD